MYTCSTRDVHGVDHSTITMYLTLVQRKQERSAKTRMNSIVNRKVTSQDIAKVTSQEDVIKQCDLLQAEFEGVVTRSLDAELHVRGFILHPQV